MRSRLGFGVGAGVWGLECHLVRVGRLECHLSPAPKDDLMPPSAKSVKAVMKTESWKW